jgi:PD-(D/E)XK nuclease superfamily
MSIFSRLLKLHNGNTPKEDFFTELVAYLFSTNKEILYDWLKYLDLLGTEVSLNAHVRTQQTFECLTHHDSDSRPDIVIELVDGTDQDIIFIESKIGSQESPGQLKRYAEILGELSGFRNKFLVYITHDFEPKDKTAILAGIPESQVIFKQARWHQFYQFLKTQTDTMLVEEIIKFMKEHQMAHNNQFSSIDVIALGNFTNSLKLMEQTMSGEVSTKFKEVLGSIVPMRATAFTQLQKHDRYLMYALLQDKWWCGLGFMLNTSSPTDYPTVFLMLEVDPRSPRRDKIIKEMKDICSIRSNWKGYDLDNSKAWSRIVLGRSLQFFLSEEDHIAAIQKFFRESLEQLSEIKSQYPELPWDSIRNGGGTSEDSNSTPSTSIEEEIPTINVQHSFN